MDLDAIRRSAQQEVAERLAGLAETMAEATRLREQAMSSTASAASRDGMIEIWVNATGTVIRTDLDPDTFRDRRPDELAAEITEVAQAAASIVRGQVEATLAEIRALADPGDLMGKAAALPGFDSLTTAPTPSTDPPESDRRRFR
ncbi:YbaB/EbfC family nucleoid-associated protein [Williamsia herbipolensis]|uniref:YbaB/EbfC family nucleoid-associated protein n=1 Tax=Williamsia herbipolensis TaxID=1603258 RepID=A0AAU4K0D6_9NOCA|nr:YbaB/EbfC family nucleoid-associated protein [Williamsia herbipolensis]